MNWTPYICIRLAFSLSLGIVMGVYFPTGLSTGMLEVMLAALMMAYVSFVSLFSFKKIRSLTGFVGLVMIVVTGYFSVRIHTETTRNDHLIHHDSISFYKVVITSPPKAGERTWKFEGHVTSIRKQGEWFNSTGRMLLYQKKEQGVKPFSYGDVMVVKGFPQRVPGPSNPHAFDYQKFLSYRNVFHQDFLSQEDVAVAGNQSPNELFGLAIAIRQWALKEIHKYIKGSQEQAIVSALVLGVTDELDDDLLRAYATSGAMHVLAVSGLHVGIIYWIILFFLKPLKNVRLGKWLTTCVTLFILWSYALVTGLSPSVLRAVTMLSFMAVAIPIQRRTNIYNTLGATAFCLLLINPYLLMSVGFQLSFLAVFGILYLFPRIYFLWTPASGFVNTIWKVTCVSIAAQLATFSLGLLYFHQFPVYFMVSNLFVIPGAFLIVVSGILVLATSPFPIIATGIGYALSFAVKILNIMIFFIDSLPMSKIDNVYINEIQCWCLILFLVMLLAMIAYRKIKFLYASFFFVVVFSLMQWQGYWKSQQEVKLTVYAINGHSAIDLMAHGDVYSLVDWALQKDENMVHFNMGNGRLAGFVNSVSQGDAMPFVKNFKGCRLILWHNRRLLQIFEKDFEFTAEFPVDFLIISNDAIKSLRNVVGVVTFKTLIVDGSNAFYVAEKLMKESEKLNINIHSTRHQGYFEEMISSL